MENALLKMYRNKRRAQRKLRELRSEHRKALDAIETIEEHRSELVEKCLELTMEKEALAEALLESKSRLHQATMEYNREGQQRERESRSTNDTQHNSIVSNLVSNLVFSVIIYMYIYVVCHAVLSSDHHIWLITNNLVFIQVLYMMVSMYTTVKTAS